MIKMIRGVYGLNVNGIVTAKDKNSEPFSASEEQEKRLVERKFAVYVDGGDVPTSPEGDSLDEMKYNDLRAFGKEHGLTFKAGTPKDEMLAAIREALAKGEEDSPEGDSLDDEADELDEDEGFDASEAVQ